MGEVGLVADMQEDRIDIEIGGTLQQRISSCLQELDTLLSSKGPIVSSMVVAEKRSYGSGKGGIVDTVLDIMGIRDIKSIPLETKLSEIGMDSLMAVEIKQTLERNFEISLSAQEIRSLSFAKLQILSDERKEVETLKKENNITSDADVAILFRTLGDETNCNENLLKVESKNIYANTNTDPVIIIPGIEGVASEIYFQIARSLSCPAYILQLMGTYACESVSEIADHFLEETLEKVFGDMNTFFLVGYSFGSMVTLELARLIEKKGIKGHVVLLDGSPSLLKRLADGQVKVTTGKSDEESIQNVVLMLVIRILFPGEEQVIWNKISSISGWMNRVDKLIEIAKPKNLYSQDYSHKMIEAVFQRLKMSIGFNEDTFVPIKSDITLIRATENTIHDIDEDYGISSCTLGETSLKFVEGNHSTILDNPKLISLINECNPNISLQQNERMGKMREI